MGLTCLQHLHDNLQPCCSPRDRLLQLPHNGLAYQVLVNKGLHPCAKEIQAKLGDLGRPLVTRLAQLVSCLAHWCPVFGE